METMDLTGDLVPSRFYMRKEENIRIWRMLLLSLFGCGALGGWLLLCARWVVVDWAR